MITEQQIIEASGKTKAWAVGEQLSGAKALAAVKQDGWALQHVKEQTPEICLAAVKQYGYALQYVNEQTPEICLAAVKQDGDALRYVKEQTPEICLEAVKQEGYALRHVDFSIFKDKEDIMIINGIKYRRVEE